MEWGQENGYTQKRILIPESKNPKEGLSYFSQHMKDLMLEYNKVCVLNLLHNDLELN